MPLKPPFHPSRLDHQRKLYWFTGSTYRIHHNGVIDSLFSWDIPPNGFVYQKSIIRTLFHTHGSMRVWNSTDPWKKKHRKYPTSNIKHHHHHHHQHLKQKAGHHITIFHFWNGGETPKVCIKSVACLKCSLCLGVKPTFGICNVQTLGSESFHSLCSSKESQLT